MSNDREREMRLKAAELHGAMPAETKPLISDYIVGWGADSGAVFLRHTSELMFKITPFEKDGDEYFRLVQFGEDEQPVKESYLCIGEMEALQELLTETVKMQNRKEQEARRVMTRDGQGGA